MKLIVLFEGNTACFEQMSTLLGDKITLLIDTEKCTERQEYEYLLDEITSSVEGEVILVKFSGRDSIIKDLGDECSEMIVCLSNNEFSKYYVENPVEMFIDLVTIFEKETV